MDFLFNEMCITILNFNLISRLESHDKQFDLSARFICKSNLWLDGSYRSLDAIAIFAVYRILIINH